MTGFAVCATTVFLSRYRFTGKERDAESGNDYFGARYYGSSMGRWMSPDWSAKYEPIPYATLGNPQSTNLYSYMHNNPLSGVDPDGHCSFGFCISDVVNAAVGFIAGHPTVANALNKAIDSSGIKISLGGVARYKEGNANVGVAASITTEAKMDGGGKSAVQGTAAASVAGVGGQANVNFTFQKDDGSFVNPLTNVSGNAKLTDSSSLADSVNSSAAIGDDGRVALGLGGTVGTKVGSFELGGTGGVQGTTSSRDFSDLAGAVVGAVVSDVRQAVQDVKELSTCGSGTCQMPH